jgi:hypothetical protein
LSFEVAFQRKARARLFLRFDISPKYVNSTGTYTTRTQRYQHNAQISSHIWPTSLRHFHPQLVAFLLGHFAGDGDASGGTKQHQKRSEPNAKSLNVGLLGALATGFDLDVPLDYQFFGLSFLTPIVNFFTTG